MPVVVSGGVEADGGGADVLAAEYVLGTLEGDAMRAAEARRAGDAAFDAEVRLWEARLYPLTGLVAAVAAPEAVWARIEASTGGAAGVAGAVGPVRAANDNRVGWWRAVALGAMAVAAGLALFIAVRPVPAPVVAVLAPTGSTASLLVAVSDRRGGLVLRPVSAVAVAADRDLELWALPAGARTPRALGLVSAGGAVVPPGVVPGTQLLVSLEPKGGSLTGLPTGPVVYGGVLRVLR